jgi:parallel beta-helix repeat protein
VGSSRVVDNTLVGNTVGLFMADADGNLIARNVARGNSGSGLDGSDFDWNTFYANTAAQNGTNGFNMTRVSHNTFFANVVTGNAGHGFRMFDDIDWNLFDRNRVTDNGEVGFLIYGGYDHDEQLRLPDHNTFTRNEIIGNGFGLYLGWDSTSNLVHANLVLRNGGSGIALVRAIDNTVTMNVACRNEGWDAEQIEGSGNVWTDNRFCTTNV